jgi:RNA polymerase sigma-70 factor (ECF subfamily)
LIDSAHFCRFPSTNLLTIGRAFNSLERNLPLHLRDVDLVAAACQGDLASFGLLYERYYRMAVGIARNRLSDPHLAEDAAQEAFAVACRTLSTLNKGDSFPQWLGTICRRTASKLAKSQPMHEQLSVDREPVSDPKLAALRQQIHEVLGQLDETSREIVLLHYYSRLSYEDIASAMNLSTQAVHGRLQRARSKLAITLNSTGVRK